MGKNKAPVISGWKAPDDVRCEHMDYGLYRCVWYSGPVAKYCDVHRMLLGTSPPKVEPTVNIPRPPIETGAYFPYQYNKWGQVFDFKKGKPKTKNGEPVMAWIPNPSEEVCVKRKSLQKFLLGFASGKIDSVLLWALFGARQVNNAMESYLNSLIEKGLHK